eukprot:TRINITY_DN612_c0_g1_i2.p2 TRINITY_DN612_c0_g1~~TRINITY_DN612_c0_g1_i2.p2  ORF type:complete len:246 (+),score=10.87 TRINITY_DN612_c0_g1_i2:531-1268(+)
MPSTSLLEAYDYHEREEYSDWELYPLEGRLQLNTYTLVGLAYLEFLIEGGQPLKEEYLKHASVDKLDIGKNFNSHFALEKTTSTRMIEHFIETLQSFGKKLTNEQLKRPELREILWSFTKSEEHWNFALSLWVRTVMIELVMAGESSEAVKLKRIDRLRQLNEELPLEIALRVPTAFGFAMDYIVPKKNSTQDTDFILKRCPTQYLMEKPWFALYHVGRNCFAFWKVKRVSNIRSSEHTNYEQLF